MYTINDVNATRCPCKGCKDRQVGCHPGCEPYTKWRKARDEINQKRWEEEQTYMLSETKRKWLIQNMRRK